MCVDTPFYKCFLTFFFSPCSEFEWKWREPRPFVQTTGSVWDYQPPENALESLNKALPEHYHLWKQGVTDKNHPLFLVFSGPGCGKSRLLDELPELAKESAKSVPELRDLLDEAFVFKITFENGMRYLNNEGVSSDEILGTRMMWQLSPMKTFDEFLDRKRKYSMRQALNAIPRDRTKPSAIFLLIDGLQMVPHTSGSSETVFAEIIKSVCNKINDSGRDFFIVGAVSATVSEPVRQVLHHSPQRRVNLVPGPLDGHAIMKSSNMLVQMLVDDMGGHGRALEMLVDSLQPLQKEGQDQDSFSLAELASSLRRNFRERYPSLFELGDDLLPLVESTFARRSFSSLQSSVSPKFTVEDALTLGLIRWNPETQTLEMPFILLWLLTTGTPTAPPLLRQLAHDNVSSGIVKRTGLEGWGSWQDFVAKFQSLKSKVFDGKEMTLAELHAGAKLSDSAAKSFIRVKKQDVVWTKKRYPSRSDRGQEGIVEMIEHEQGEAPFKTSDILVVNGPGAPAADIFSRVHLRDPDASVEDREGVWVNETFACRHWQKETLSQSDYENEREKAAGSEDVFMMFVTGDSDDVDLESKKKVPAHHHHLRNGLVGSKNFSAYFGPFAGRAFRLREEPPNINTTPRSVLEAVEGIGPARAKTILQERICHGPFNDLQDAMVRTHIPEHILNQLTF